MEAKDPPSHQHLSLFTTLTVLTAHHLMVFNTANTLKPMFCTSGIL